MTIRNWISIVSRVVNLLIVAFVLGTLYLNLDNDQAAVSYSFYIKLINIFI